jgi:hypothetical protein
VLYSRASRVAFAHYPKTGGTSLQHWFRQAFPDARLLVPDNPHLPVRTALEMITAADRQDRRQCWRPWRSAPREPRPRLVVGVLREPFEMLVSLFEYWRDFPFPAEPTADFIRTARRGAFVDFVRMAVVDGQLPTYEWFFDVGGPAWPNTRLLDFQTLEEALPSVARDLRLPRPPSLEHRNSHRGTRDLDAYRDTAGTLVDRVHSYFRWYYTHAPGLEAGWPTGLVA